MMKNVEEQLADLSVKVIDLVQKTEITAKEYYENVEYKNAYNILVPAVASVGATISSIIKDSLIPIVMLEGLVFIIYLSVAFFNALLYDSSKKTVKVKNGSDDDDDDDEDDMEDVIDAIEEAAEEEKTSDKKKKNRK